MERHTYSTVHFLFIIQKERKKYKKINRLLGALMQKTTPHRILEIQ